VNDGCSVNKKTKNEDVTVIRTGGGGGEGLKLEEGGRREKSAAGERPGDRSIFTERTILKEDTKRL